MKKKKATPKGNEQFTIKKGTPLPRPVHPGGGRSLKYPWDKMEKGDCFNTGMDVTQFQDRSMAQVGNSWAKRNGSKAKFSQRTVDGCLWVWRVA